MNTLIIDSDLSFQTAAQYINKVDDLLCSDDEGFAIDFSKAGFVDSAGVAFCLHCARKLSAKKGEGNKVQLLSPNDRLLSLLKEYRLKDLFELS